MSLAGVSNREDSMRRFALVCTIVVLAGCAKPETKPAADTTAAVAPVPPPPPAPISLSDVAGKWNMKTMAENSDSVLVELTMTATADTTGWVLNLPKRKPVPAHVMASGDSIMVDAGPYESVLRKGQQVTTHGVYHMTGGKLMGITVAHYKTTKADSVVRLRSEGTRAP